jgi:ComF family protein
MALADRLRSYLSQATVTHRLHRLRDRSLAPWLCRPCPLCSRPAPACLCLDCQRQFDACHRPQFDHSPIDTLQPSPARWPIWSWGSYDGTLKQSIAAFKYQNNLAIGDLLGQSLAQDWPQIRAMQSDRHRSPQLIPIPLHTDKLAQRGFNQVSLIGQALGQATNLTVLDRGLIRQRATQPQFELGPQARHDNLKDAFCLGPDLQRRSAQPLIILDDIYTSGATARSAAATLETAGHQVLGIWVVARAHSRRRASH